MVQTPTGLEPCARIGYNRPMATHDADNRAWRERPDDEGGGFTELLKKAAYLGIGALFATQETATRIAKDLKLPREAVALILEQVDRNRSELSNAIRSAVREVLKDADLVKLAKRTLDGMNVEVNAQIKLSFDENPKRE